MESFYKISGRAAEINNRIEELDARLVEMYEDNGGEITESTEAIENAKSELENLKQECIADIINNSDAYAEIALDKMAKKKVLVAEMKAVKEEQQKILDRYQARINRLDSSIDFWKQNFNEAMNLAGTTKIGGAKTDKMHSVYFTTTCSVECDNDVLISPYEESIRAFDVSLPDYLSIDIKVNKVALKGMTEMPAGAMLIKKQNINIK